MKKQHTDVIATCLTAFTVTVSLIPKPGFGRDPVISTARPQMSITLRVVNEANVEEKTLLRAQRDAKTILGRAGLVLDWVPCEDGPADWRSHNRCQQPTGPAEFWLRIGLSKPAGTHSDTVGYTVLDAAQQIGAAGICYPAVEELVRGHHAETYQVLSAAIVHEIGHLLLGGARAHSPQGIMVARWSAREFELLSIGELRFTAGQAQQLRDEIRNRRRTER